ncbi:MAG: hypothetical protein ABI082_00320 [Dokdonella sp.]
MDRLDEALRGAVIAKCLTRRLDPAGDGSVGNYAPIPHLLDDLVSGYQPLAIAHQQCEHSEYLRFHRAHFSVGAQLVLGQIQLEGTESVDHRRSIEHVGAISHEPPGFLHEVFKHASQARVEIPSTLPE